MQSNRYPLWLETFFPPADSAAKWEERQLPAGAMFAELPSLALRLGFFPFQ